MYFERAPLRATPSTCVLQVRTQALESGDCSSERFSVLVNGLLGMSVDRTGRSHEATRATDPLGSDAASRGRATMVLPSFVGTGSPSQAPAVHPIAPIAPIASIAPIAERAQGLSLAPAGSVAARSRVLECPTTSGASSVGRVEVGASGDGCMSSSSFCDARGSRPDLRPLKNITGLLI